MKRPPETLRPLQMPPSPMDAGDAGLLVLSRKLNVMSCNPMIQRLLRRTLIPSEPCPLDSIFTASDVGKANASIEGVLDRGECIKGITSCLKTPDGQQVLCEYSAEPLFDEDRIIIGVVFHFATSRFS